MNAHTHHRHWVTMMEDYALNSGAFLYLKRSLDYPSLDPSDEHKQMVITTRVRQRAVKRRAYEGGSHTNLCALVSRLTPFYLDIPGLINRLPKNAAERKKVTWKKESPKGALLLYHLPRSQAESHLVRVNNGALTPIASA